MSETPPEDFAGLADQVPYDSRFDRPDPSEFASLNEAAAEIGLSPASVPPVARDFIKLPEGQRVSLLTWGVGEPELVFLHGGGQNAHTWDLVLLLLGRPAVAIDLPGHGHSSWRRDQDYGPTRNAVAVAAAIERHAAQARVVIGMSLGGLTLIHMAATRPDLVRRAMLVDVTPGSPEAAAAMSRHQLGAVQLTRERREFTTREEMIAAAASASPGRAASALRRGVIHNSRQISDRTWVWRYDRSVARFPFLAGELWDDLARLSMPTMLVTGAQSGFVTDADRARAKERLPSIRVETVAAAGHAVQSDQPTALASLITALSRRPASGETRLSCDWW